MNDLLCCEKYTVTGRVQGVGFRYYSMRCAKKRFINGAARNCSDGNVEIIVIGNPDALELFFQDIRKGPPLSKVHSIVRIPCSEQEYTPEMYDIVFTEV